jgi:two-component system, sporulation sensor kinase D
MLSVKQWRFWLLITALVIGTASLLYTNFLIDQLAQKEKERVELWAESVQALYIADDSDFINFLFNNVIEKTNFAIILTDSNDKIKSYKGLDTTKTLYKNQEIERKKIYDSLYFYDQLDIMKSQHEPLIYQSENGEKEKIYYRDSSLLVQLRAYPYVQLFVVIVFFVSAYFAFRSATRSEQNKVWVGMAKETAHQFGTPISSLMAWIENLKLKLGEEDPYLLEMQKDLKRLELITERFSKIGSNPDLQQVNLKEVLENSVEYMRKRTSSKIQYALESDDVIVKLNVPLFEWVIENLCKNAINAIEKEGQIHIKAKHRRKRIEIDVSDTGKGIPKNKWKEVFKPGYTTRKRGWGLGLTLVKRIVENYHDGEIFVKESTINQGTTFRITIKTYA